MRVRKIDGIKRLHGMGLKTLDIKEFTYSNINKAKTYAQFLIKRDGTFNLRTDVGYVSQYDVQLPFIKDCTLEQLESLSQEYKDSLTYLVHEGIDDSSLAGQGVVFLDERKSLVGTVNYVDKTSLRKAMTISKNIVDLEVNDGDSSIFSNVRNNLVDLGIRNKVEVSVYNDGKIVYWQLLEKERLDCLNAYSAINKGKISLEEGIADIDPDSLRAHCSPTLKSNNLEKITGGIGTGQGGASGKAVFNLDDLKQFIRKEYKPIFFVDNWMPEYGRFLGKLSGVVARKGSASSHIVTLANGAGLPCIVGCEDIDLSHKKIGNKSLDLEDEVSIDAISGKVYFGHSDIVPANLTPEFLEFIQFCDSLNNINVLANINNAEEAKLAKQYGAEGIGLCRSEHMFFESPVLKDLQNILIEKPAEKSFDNLLDFQKKEYSHIFEEMKGLPINIRLLDPPLNEFLEDKDYNETNPLMGLRGGRLAIVNPPIYQNQVQAIIESAIDTGVSPSITIPFVSSFLEYQHIKGLMQTTIAEVFKRRNKICDYQISPMIEIPSLLGDINKLAKNTNLFSYGTNDLTQFLLAMSRDDSSSFVKNYINVGIINQDPAISLPDVVQNKMKKSIRSAKRANPKLKVGVCGEHVKDFNSIEKLNEMNIDYVSCNPSDIPLVKFLFAKSSLKK